MYSVISSTYSHVIFFSLHYRVQSISLLSYNENRQKVASFFCSLVFYIELSAVFLLLKEEKKKRRKGSSNTIIELKFHCTIFSYTRSLLSYIYFFFRSSVLIDLLKKKERRKKNENDKTA